MPSLLREQRWCSVHISESIMQCHNLFEQLDVTGALELGGPHFRRGRVKFSFARLRPVSLSSRMQNLLQHTIF
jgi:hypothetical protein